MDISVDQHSRSKNSPDIILLGTLLLLLGFGLAMLFSASYYRADSLFSDPLRFIRNQLLYAGLGIILAFITYLLPIKLITKFVPALVLISLILLILTLIPGLGVEYLGARRQIQIANYTFQPTELAKFTIILYLARFLAKKQNNLDNMAKNLIPAMILVSIFITLVYLQNDFSSAVFIAIIALSMFFVAGVKFRYFLSLLIAATPLGIILLLSKEHRLRRLVAFLDNSRDPIGEGYQVRISLDALKDGGLWGRGLGNSLKKFGELPEAQSDFIFAVLGEELGYFGVIFILLLFVVLAWRGFAIAFNTKSDLQSLIVYGITTLITVQAGINMAVVSGMVPTTGIPMPFFSSGGSHLVVILILCGLLLNVSKNIENKAGE